MNFDEKDQQLAYEALEKFKAEEEQNRNPNNNNRYNNRNNNNRNPHHNNHYNRSQQQQQQQQQHPHHNNSQYQQHQQQPHQQQQRSNYNPRHNQQRQYDKQIRNDHNYYQPSHLNQDVRQHPYQQNSNLQYNNYYYNQQQLQQQHQHHNPQYKYEFSDQRFAKQNARVSSHYDQKSNTPIYLRRKSRIICLRNMNNWVKSMLIQEFTKTGDTVLDICGGKLGDLQKWEKVGINRLIVSDISLESLRHGVERINPKLPGLGFHTTFICCDCFSPKLIEVFPKKTKVDVVSCQFSLHYSFRSEESARGLLQNVSKVLKQNGHFIGTLPNACYIVKRCKELKSNRFGNSVFKIEFIEKEPVFSAFGSTYKFYLEDAINLEEYLVHMDILVTLAREYGLELVKESRFHDFIYNKTTDQANIDLLKRMNCLNHQGLIPVDEWEALGIYNTFAFKKITPDLDEDDSYEDEPLKEPQNKITADDIIINL
ncbi:hypothetical protein CYY_005151 [Polysphondylium violaceum]|uniref:mRNA (guanine-N(7))-methyltransferase n=1 Tax=Polysphondylium violaceum TaxID=133409 RepID=A0A8J4V4H3_9MYCE|nr:hypothetical protein CYY_005151 [Polysphondylium violaceum]